MLFAGNEEFPSIDLSLITQGRTRAAWKSQCWAFPTCRAISWLAHSAGDEWIRSMRSLALKVPASVCRTGFNV